MNTIDLLDRTSDVTMNPTTSAPEAGSPPLRRPPEEGADAHRRWPASAQVTVVLTLIAAVLSAIGAAVVANAADDTAERELKARVTALLVERDEAVASVAELDAELAALRQRAAALESDRDGLVTEAAELHRLIDAVTAERDSARAYVTELRAAVADAQQQVAAAIDDSDRLAGLFPIRIAGSLTAGGTPGRYAATWREAFCSGLSTCGRPPAIGTVTISPTPERYLRIAIGGLVDAGLYRIEGGLHTVVASTTAVPACGGVARSATVTVSVFPSGFSIDDDGDVTTTSLAAAVTVDAPATAACAAALAFYSAELTPKV